MSKKKYLARISQIRSVFEALTLFSGAAWLGAWINDKDAGLMNILIIIAAVCLSMTALMSFLYGLIDKKNVEKNEYLKPKRQVQAQDGWWDNSPLYYNYSNTKRKNNDPWIGARSGSIYEYSPGLRTIPYHATEDDFV
ncbi:hypothetical protein GCM10023116_14960 [Kistimonas scapharcae]|uniref:Uncharacterized protein n=1 Tax=Kistimonas scapharcae TaxID=1036133 RepID=A0ABP8V033_9GAMM